MAVWDRPDSLVSRPKIAIGIPHTENASLMWSMRTMAPLLFLPTNWCDKVPQMCRGVPQSVARDQIVDLSLQDPKITHILWVDTDSVCVKQDDKGNWGMIDPNLYLQMLYQVNQPIVSGLYRAKQKEGFNYAAWVDAHLPDGKQGFIPIQSYTGNYFQVDVIGMGFCLVKREVYEKVPKPWYPWPDPSPSEDFNFCIKARKFGYAINIFADVKIAHIGNLIIMPDASVRVLDV